MRILLLALIAVGFAGAAHAQSKSAPSGMMGTAGVKTHLEALHYGDVHDLRRGYDGQWTGNATQNGVEKQVTISPKGDVIAR
jgi:hypothetical protein